MSPVATLTLQAGVCFWPRPTVSTLTGYAPATPPLPSLPTGGIPEDFDLRELLLHARAVVVAELDSLFCVEQPLQVVAALPTGYHVWGGRASDWLAPDRTGN